METCSMRIVYQQIIEAIKWYSKNSGKYADEICEDIVSDIAHGSYDDVELEEELKFWKNF